MSELLKVASVTESSVVKSDTLFSRFNILFIFQEKKLSNIEMEQINKDMMPTIKSENENSKMDIEGTVIKLELKSPLTQIQKLPNGRLEDANQDKHIVEIKHENEESQNARSIEETIDIKLENEDIRSYICGKSLNSEENSFAMKESFKKTTKVKEQNSCKICKKSFARKSYLNLHCQSSFSPDT